MLLRSSSGEEAAPGIVSVNFHGTWSPLGPSMRKGQQERLEDCRVTGRGNLFCAVPEQHRSGSQRMQGVAQQRVYVAII
jgi:hypothetical protein